MIDAPVQIRIAPAGDVTLLDLWSGDVDTLCAGLPRLQVEPQRWWLIGGGEQVESLAAGIADHGALAPIGGGLVRATICGPGWRSLLMIAGLFDAEDLAFATGDTVSTMIHHIAVRISVTGPERCDVYFNASFAPALVEHWSRAADATCITIDDSLRLVLGDPGSAPFHEKED